MITREEAEAILEIEKGADIYSYSLAKTIREMERRGVKGLFDITKPMMYTGDGTDQMPYFGAIATKKGIEIAIKTLKEIK